MLRCRPKHLDLPDLLKASVEAVRINPANAVRAQSSVPLPPQHIALLTGKYWSSQGVKLGVTFLSPTLNKGRILAAMNSWGQGGRSNVAFSESATGEVRVAFAADGFWSYIGTDLLLIPHGQPTMNLQGFDGDMPDSEYRRVVKHETGHTLGFPHEHQRREVVANIDPDKAYQLFWQEDGWDRATVDQQVLTSLDEATLLGTPPDRTSIMCYFLPGRIMKDGRDVPGGDDIDPSDAAFCIKVYPGTVAPPPPSPTVTLTLAKDLTAGNHTVTTGGWPPWASLSVDRLLKAGKHQVS